MTQLVKLRLLLALFFLALAGPTVALIYQAYQRLQWETFHQHQSLAEAFSSRVDQSLRDLVRLEDAALPCNYHHRVVRKTIKRFTHRKQNLFWLSVSVMKTRSKPCLS